jgi:hypothetical protein
MLSGVGLGQGIMGRGSGYCTCYLVNRSPSSSLDDKTPHEVWTGKKPSLTHLRVFDCDVYVHVPKENKSKLDKRLKSVSLLGIKMV